MDFTETHQVLIEVGYARGAEMASRLELNNIICNFQALPNEEGFTSAGGLRMGVSEMTRFGMEEGDFGQVAQLIHDVVVHDRNVKRDVVKFRQRFQEMRYCFSGKGYDELVERLHQLL